MSSTWEELLNAPVENQWYQALVEDGPDIAGIGIVSKAVKDARRAKWAEKAIEGWKRLKDRERAGDAFDRTYKDQMRRYLERYILNKPEKAKQYYNSLPQKEEVIPGSADEVVSEVLKFPDGKLIEQTIAKGTPEKTMRWPDRSGPPNYDLIKEIASDEANLNWMKRAGNSAKYQRHFNFEKPMRNPESSWKRLEELIEYPTGKRLKIPGKD